MAGGPGISVLLKAITFLLFAQSGFDPSAMIDVEVDVIERSKYAGSFAAFPAEDSGIRIEAATPEGYVPIGTIELTGNGFAEVSYQTPQGPNGTFALDEEVQTFKSSSGKQLEPMEIETEDDTWSVGGGAVAWILSSDTMDLIFVMPKVEDDDSDNGAGNSAGSAH